MTDAGLRFVEALAAKDDAAIIGLFAPQAVFRGMTPGRFWESSDPDEIVHDILYQWFEPADVIEDVVEVTTSMTVDRHRVDYVLHVRNGAGLHLVEQRAYYDLDGAGRIERMHVMCAGFRPVEG